MNTASNESLIEKAKAILNPRRVGSYTIGDVGCALVSDQGNVYLGVCIDTSSSLGFCAEHSAIAAMITAGEYRIQKIVAVATDGEKTYILPPCGRCREFIRQIHPENIETEVILETNRVLALKELLPYHDWFAPIR